MTTTLAHIFKSVLNRSVVLAQAYERGAVKRPRDINPADFALAVVACALGDEDRSLATARRLFDRLAGFMPEESSFYVDSLRRWPNSSSVSSTPLSTTALSSNVRQSRRCFVEPAL